LEEAKRNFEGSRRNMRRAIRTLEEKELEFSVVYKRDLARAFGRKRKNATSIK
jgi:hypothetical protein